MLGLHDDEAVSRIRVFGRHQQIDVLEDAATRLVQDKAAQTLIVCDPARLFPEGIARWRGHAADDDIAHFAFRMARNQMNELACAHGSNPVFLSL